MDVDEADVPKDNEKSGIVSSKRRVSAKIVNLTCRTHSEDKKFTESMRSDNLLKQLSEISN